MKTGVTQAAVVLAGGFGTRLRGVLPDLPKPMAPVAGRPFVEWIVRFLQRQGIRRVALSTGYRAETLAAHFVAGKVPGVAVVCVREETPLGTAGGFLHAVDQAGLTAPGWLVCNGDSLVTADWSGLFRALEDEATDAAVLALWRDDAARYGSLEVDAAGRLTGFGEKRPGAAWINAGVYLFRSRLLEQASIFPRQTPLSFETEVFPRLIAAGGNIQVVRVHGDFLDIGLPESLAQAEDFLERNRHFWPGEKAVGE